MPAMTVRVKVLRPMIGDKRYERGDYRDLAVADAERLASTGAVEILGQPKRAKPAAQPKKKSTAKAVRSAPRNKAQKPSSNKGEGK
jgi:hypothetical protein